MRVLLLTYEYPPKRGGISTYLRSLFADPPEGISVDVRVIPPREHWLISLARFFVTARRPDLIVVSHVIPLGYVAWALSRASRTRFLVICHGTDVLTARRTKRKRSYMRFVLGRAHVVIANSAFTATLLNEEGIAVARVIPPCVDSIAHGSRRVPAPPIILSVGRLVPRKGFDTAIAALPQVRAAVPDARYVVVGNGPDRERLLGLADSYGVGDAVEIRSDVDETGRQALLTEAAVLAHPARQVCEDVEGFGLAVIEASAAGLPVVVGRSGGAPETVRDGETGALIPPDDPPALARAIIALLQDPARAHAMGEAGMTFVRREFSCHAVRARFWGSLHA